MLGVPDQVCPRMAIIFRAINSLTTSYPHSSPSSCEKSVLLLGFITGCCNHSEGQFLSSRCLIPGALIIRFETLFISKGTGGNILWIDRKKLRVYRLLVSVFLRHVLQNTLRCVQWMCRILWLGSANEYLRIGDPALCGRPGNPSID